MPVILRDQDNHIVVTSINNTGVIDHVPAHVYNLRVNMAGELLLVKDRKRFEVPMTKFGKHRKYHTTITTRYDRHGSALGVLLYGEKGTGKSLLSEDLANWMLGQDLPVLLIDIEIPAALLNAALSVIGPCMVYFDEFGKVYDESARSQFLTTFSDTSLKGVLFVVTGNSSDEFSNYMFNRPGRFEFAIHYTSLSAEVAKEVATHHHLNDEMSDLLIRHTVLNSSSMDIATKLASVLRQCKTIEEAEELVEILNVPRMAWYDHSVTEAFYKGERVPSNQFSIRSADKRTGVAVIDLLSHDKQPIKQYTVNFMSDEAYLISKEDVVYNRMGKKAGDDYVKTGSWSLKVDEDLSFTFLRALSPHTRGVSFNCESSEQWEARHAPAKEAERGVFWRTTPERSGEQLHEGVDNAHGSRGELRTIGSGNGAVPRGMNLS